ncbi:peptidoglycan editing factor PgeF [Agrobacterium rhizogenes]|uniref:peptidoglycan editing factor PgeF n=1 Tax=Rhizobium rhizogenes TaxID=359 RepID=UPI000562B446|nr:peptidoglycan editing factor PgeF [Rhizobium rhizogenes]NTF81781.1 peptidoglycan editing factor PgeF [Rhizobium rhizogenes]NTH77798.1 peptidoglycan editing factor PgeF [Rhizobium rhizogenes]NTH83806.1 peptidoglycan editing factor PgeF [Rhizobium rhizogenes]NTI75208.1 peptidoglycan editing factor PgeF [Rhizobium rhizogenes]
MPTPIESTLLSAAKSAGIRHGYFTREGGVSEGLYRGLNVGLGSHDDRAHVEENRRRVASWFGLPLERLATVHQVHSPDVITVGMNYDGNRPQADAIVTATPGVVLGVLAADCGPILFADSENRVIGAAHAGWKGALTGVLENTIEAMVALGAKRETITACLGPSISQASYEVGPEFVDRFTAYDPDYTKYFIPSEKPGHAMFDLPALTVNRLRKAGVTAESLALCTYPDPDRFFSYRRTTHAKEPDYGRQISAIAIEETS